jgi:hypothetical protein
MFGAPTGGVGSPITNPSRRRSADVLGGFRASPGGSPVIEEEGQGPSRPYGRSAEPSPSLGSVRMARVLYDFEAADDDEVTVESEFARGCTNIG